MDKDAKTASKDTVLAEYGAMRIEIRERIAGQGRVAAGSVALVGGFIGVLATVKLQGNVSLVAALLSPDNTHAIHVFGVLCASLVLGMELLLSFWAYQLFLVFRISGYLKKLEAQMRTQFQIPDDLLVLSWDSYAASMADISVPKDQKLVRLSLQVVSYVQPLSFFVLGGLGLVGVGAGAWVDKGPMIAVFGALFLGLVGLGLVMLGLHKWVSGVGFGPDAGMRARFKEDPVTTEGGSAADKGEEDK